MVNLSQQTADIISGIVKDYNKLSWNAVLFQNSKELTTFVKTALTGQYSVISKPVNRIAVEAGYDVCIHFCGFAQIDKSTVIYINNQLRVMQVDNNNGQEINEVTMNIQAMLRSYYYECQLKN